MKKSFSYYVIVTALLGCSRDNAPLSTTPPPAVHITGAPIFEATVRGYPSGATTLADGRVVTADSWTGRLEFFDRSGRLLKSVGRKGTGPGEYSTPFVLGRCDGENIYVRDGGLSRVSVVDTSGSFLRSFSADASAAVCNSENEFILVRPDVPKAPAQAWERPQIQGTVFFAKGDRKPKAVIPRMFAYEPTTMGPVSRFALGSDRFFATYGFPDSQFVDVFNFRGKKLTRFATNLPTRIVTDDMFNGYIVQSVGSFQQPEARARSHAFLRQFQKPLHAPVASQLLVDPDDNLWLVRTFPGDRTTLIRVFDKRGAMLADVELPVQMQIFEVGTDYILGMHIRAGRPNVAMYSFDSDQLHHKQ